MASKRSLKFRGILSADCGRRTLFVALHGARDRYYHSISKKSKNHLFLEGWLKRIGSIKFEE
ncbi:MAG: putative peptidoglycan-binding domain-containing protein [Draconibacterium sp.]